jgi:enamine deaminase RidA (YjgF/YER057c/UK114 family)
MVGGDRVNAKIINPESLGAPRGYSNGVLARGDAVLFVAGQVGWDQNQQIVPGGFAAQFEQALRNLLAVVGESGGRAENIGRMTIYVTSIAEYEADLGEVGAAYRRQMGRWYPAMTLVQVAALLEPGAVVEVEATAVV